MLIRFALNNIYSFGELKEINMLPAPKFSRFSEHKYQKCGIDILKIASIYGANGSGKSNLIKALSLLQSMVIEEEIPSAMLLRRYKFLHNTGTTTTLVVEFINNNKPYIYGIEINDKFIVKEELYVSGVGKKEDKLIFERICNNEKNSNIIFNKEFYEDQESKLLGEIIQKNLLKNNKTCIKVLKDLDNPLLEDVKNVYHWFSEKLRVIMPDAKPIAITHLIDVDDIFHKYAEEVLGSFNLGVKGLKSIKKPINDFFGSDNNEDIERIIKDLDDSPGKILGLRSRRGDELIVVEEAGEVFVKQLKAEHQAGDNLTVDFDMEEESDGTIRLLDFIPAFSELVSKEKVFIIDEIERSIHPLLIKELIRKFSLDNKTKGQLIFSTHESNLLDQNIFRQDEIWFVEKDKFGKTDLYSLSDFKVHNTIDIRKGYLSGRYGSIPFLANLKDINWHLK